MIIKQPNGFYAVFDPACRDFERINLTKEEAIAHVVASSPTSKKTGRKLYLWEIQRYAYKADQAGLKRWEKAMNDVCQFYPDQTYAYYNNRMRVKSLTYGEVQA